MKATKTYLDLLSVLEFTEVVKTIPICISALLLIASLIFSFEETDTRLDVRLNQIVAVVKGPDIFLDTIAMGKPQPIVLEHLEDTRTMDKKIFCWCYAIGSELDVDPYLIRAIVKVESHDDPNARGDGSVGLMQLIPSCHKLTMEQYGYSVEDLFDPYKNIKVGATYLSNLIHKYDDISYALVCYSKGEGGAQSYGKRSSHYSDYVLSVYNKLKGGDICGTN